MKKYLFSFIFILAAFSCSKSNCGLSTMDEPSTVEFTVEAGEILTKSPGVTSLNENAIKTLHFYMFPRKNNQTVPSGDAVFCGYRDFMTSPAQGSTSVKVNLGEQAFSQLFPLGQATCFLYVVVNMPENALPSNPNALSGITYDVLKATVATANDESLTGPFVVNDKMKAFVMDGLSYDVTFFSRYDKDQNNGNARISCPVDRLAAKMELKVTIDPTVHGKGDDDVTRDWHPYVDDMIIQFRKGVRSSYLTGAYVPSAADYFSTGDRSFKREGEADAYYYTNAYPFYTYPIKWTPGSKDQPYFYLVLKWSYTLEDGTESTPVPSYYKILLAGDELQRNTWHRINLKVGALGSWTPEEPKISIKQTYNVADWKNALSGSGGGGDISPTVEAEIQAATYLVVPQTYFEVKNLNNLKFKYAASGNCKISNVKVTKANVNAGDSRVPSTTGLVVLDNAGKEVTVTNTLVNITTSGKDYDVVPYTYTFRISLVSDESIYEDIKVVQYPAIYIRADKNPGANTNGNVIINKNTSANANGWDEANGLTGGNKDSNMYVITITALDSQTKCYDGKPYIVGDPRTKLTTTDIGRSGSMKTDASGKAWNINSYLGTSTSDEYMHHIAPQFRIASSYGVVTTLNKGDATSRCAAYQEDGFPAGRWRVPTYAELSFINKLSGDGKLNVLFSAGSYYWTSVGAYTYNNGTLSGPSTSKSYVRCVYDTWYWGDSRIDNRRNFTWGF